MNAIFFKEWIKTRWYLLLACIVTLGFAGYSMLRINRVVELNGGIVVWDGGQSVAEVPLAIAGIMSDDTLVNVNRDLENAKKAAYDLGVSTGIDPFMTLSFMALPVIPSLRITTRGVFDVTTQRYV